MGRGKSLGAKRAPASGALKVLTALALIGLLLQGAGPHAGVSGGASRVVAWGGFCGGPGSAPGAPLAPHDHAHCMVCSLGAVVAVLPLVPPWPATPLPAVAAITEVPRAPLVARRAAYLSRAPPALG